MGSPLSSQFLPSYRYSVSFLQAVHWLELWLKRAGQAEDSGPFSFSAPCTSFIMQEWQSLGDWERNDREWPRVLCWPGSTPTSDRWWMARYEQELREAERRGCEVRTEVPRPRHSGKCPDTWPGCSEGQAEACFGNRRSYFTLWKGTGKCPGEESNQLDTICHLLQ